MMVMEKKVVVVCVGVGFLGLLSAALGFAAEAKRIKMSDVTTTANGQCLYPRSPALALALTSAVALVVAQAIINTIAGCICCKKQAHPSGSHWTIAFISFSVSWITFLIAFLLLLTGAALNDQHGQESMYFGNYCYVVKPGVFSGGALLSLASVALSIIYYGTLSTSKNVGQPSGSLHNQGIVMGQPQIPPQSNQPVFVPEDTYNRQQFP